jgi:hypothetical protein
MRLHLNQFLLSIEGIAKYTKDRAKYLFREPLKELARKHDLINSRIVTFQGGEKTFDKMFTRRGTPVAFFNDLLQLIRDIYDQKPW